MKQHMALPELAAEVQRAHAAKRDVVASSPRILMTRESKLNLVGAPEFQMMPVSDHAHGQVATYTGIPKRYYDLMKVQAPELLADNVNHWFGEAQNDKRMVRTLDGRVRAFLSDSYRRLDNAPIFEAFVQAMMQVGQPIADGNPSAGFDWRVGSAGVTDQRMYVKIIFPSRRQEVRVGDAVCYGLSISNSEIGAGAVELAEFYEVLRCLNGMKIATPIKRRHVGRAIEEGEVGYSNETIEADDRAFFLRFRDQVKQLCSPENFTRRIEEMRSAARDRIETPVEQVVEVLANRAGFSDDERGSVLELLVRGGDLTRWGLANAVTAFAGEHPSYDRASELEALGGKIITLKPGEWRRLQDGKGEVALAEAA